MKVVLTGSLGHISRPLTQTLAQKGHHVTVISSSNDRKKEIEDLGAKAAIGSLEDAAFLTSTFTGADVVYSMVPPNNYLDQNLDLIAYYQRLGNNYKEAVSKAGIKRLVNLSTIGGNMDKGNGQLVGAHNVEETLNSLPSDISITHMRPTSFFYNLLGYVQQIKAQGFISANYGGEDIVPWVSPKDIAVAVGEEIEKPFTGRNFRYVASDERSCNETARVLGQAIGKPDLEWKVVSDEEMMAGLVSAGLNPKIAGGLTEMYAGMHSCLLVEHYNQHKPTVMGKVKLEEYAKEFAAAYNKS